MCRSRGGVTSTITSSRSPPSRRGGPMNNVGRTVAGGRGSSNSVLHNRSCVIHKPPSVLGRGFRRQLEAGGGAAVVGAAEGELGAEHLGVAGGDGQAEAV